MLNSRQSFCFETVDYVVFGLMLLMSALIGVYYGFVKKNKIKKPETDSNGNANVEVHAETMDYLMSNKTMNPVPVALSLISSYVSGVTILGTPAEVYNYGTQYWLIAIAIWLMGFTVSTVYLPVFSKLQVKSSYEYLELRFNSHVRTIISVLYILDEIMFLPIVVYVPSLAFNQVTGINIHIVGSVVCAICVFYTFVGGLKAVIWTDTWQIIVMFVSVVTIDILGTINIGSLSEVWNRSLQGGRIQFLNVNPSLYERHTIWSVLLGGYFYWTSYNAVHQTMVQRYLSLPTLKQSKLSVGLFTAGVSIFVTLCSYAGLVIFAYYKDCDPLSIGAINASDQLFPLYIMQVIGSVPGIAGLFIAGVFGAALSSLSVVLNSTTAVLLEDFIKGCFKMKISDRAAIIFVKVSIIVLGITTVLSMLIVEKLGGVLALATSLSAIAAGTTFGIFTLGMLVPFANSCGAIVGGSAGAILSGWMSFGSQYAAATGQLADHSLPVSTDGCPANTTINKDDNYVDESLVFPLYRLSYHWISPAGIFTVLFVGIIVSWFTRKRYSKSVNRDYLSPVIYRFLKKDDKNIIKPTVYLVRGDSEESRKKMLETTTL